MKIREYPSREELLQYFDYHPEGYLIHKNRKDTLGRSRSHYVGKKAGNLDSKNRWRITLHGKFYEGHRLIWIWHYGSIPEGLIVDHIDGNSLNNQIENLRTGTVSQNNANRRQRHYLATSKFHGVSWNRNRKKWVAQCKKDGEVIYVGSFESEFEAAKAHDSYVRGLHSGFEILNFPEQLNEFDLHEYQKKAVQFVETNNSCALWVDLGLGKTAITITAMANLFQRFEVGKVLIIAPLRVATHTWPEEFKKWMQASNLSYSVVCGSWGQRAKAVASNTDIHIINRENVAWLVEHFSRGMHKPSYEWPYDLVVIDESSSFKSSNSKRFKALKKVLHKINRVIELTGTPASNGLMDVWSQIFLIDKGQRLGKTFSGFRDRYFTSDYMGYSWELRPGSEEEIYERLQDVCLTLSAKDYLELPQRIDNTIALDMDKKSLSQYKELERDFLLELESDTVSVLNAANLSNKLLQFCNGALYTSDSKWEVLHNVKLDTLENLVEAAAGQPILVAYNFKSDRERIKRAFKQAVCIDEAGAIERWNAGEVSLLLAHPASAGHGLNLQKGGNIIVWFGLSWSLELYQQFNARLHRQGQTKPVVVYHLAIKNSVDTTVLEALASKQVTQNALLNALKRDIERMI